MNDPPLGPKPSAGSVRDSLDSLVRGAQIDMVFRRAQVANWLGVPVGALICWVLWRDVPQAWLTAWFIMKLITSTLRTGLAWQYARDKSHPPGYWGARFQWALVLDGAVLGLLGTVLMPVRNPQLAAIMLATVVAIAALGLVVLSVHLRASLSLVLPLMVPPLLYQFWLGGPVQFYVGVGMTIFLGIICVEGRRAAEHTRSMLRLRFQMDELAAQRQQALDLAQRNSAVKDRFLATMSHEMRTPLHGILGLASMLQRSPLTGQSVERAETTANSLETLQRTGEHLLGIINDVLDFSKIESGHMRLSRETFDLAAVLESVADVARVSAAGKGLWLKLHNPLPKPCWVTGDATRLRQILLNLTGNAVKFTAAGGVTLGAQRTDHGTTVFDVTDTGQGVAVDQRESIFMAFHQLDSSDGRRHGGTGLGLTISRELARAMGGDLVCLMASSGGATFRLTSVLESAVAPPIAAPESQALHARLTGRVLLVEDNPVNALVGDAILARIGVEVTVVTDGAQAVSEATQGDYDLVLMDCQMPGVDGFEATKRIRAFERREGRAPMPIVALTANALEGDRERSLKAGMDDHLAKPFREADMVELLARFFATVP